MTIVGNALTRSLRTSRWLSDINTVNAKHRVKEIASVVLLPRKDTFALQQNNSKSISLPYFQGIGF